MSQTVYRYNFNEKIPLQEVEDSLMLAVLAIECLHGRSLVRLDASFSLDKGKRTCVVDAGTEVGGHIASVFTGFLTREFGEDTFRVERVDGSMPKESNNWQRIPGLLNKREIKQIKEPGKEYYLRPRGKDNWGQEVFTVHLRNQEKEQDKSEEIL
ncbi:MAG: hypothetical protein HZA78_03075 [Candidatus Schekmanbacteria bacterium]|nr:hypothetical protein [Candidatus Schekmanbacteria bacterium]